MKTLLFALISISFLSCGVPVEEQSADDQMGRDWALQADEKFQTSEINLVKSICSSLAAKSTFFKNVYVGEGSILEYSVSSNNCDTDELTSNGKATMAVANSSAGLVFNSSSSSYISDILTDESDTIEDLCNAATSGAFDIHNYKKEGNVVDFFKIGSSSAGNCDAASDEVCFTIFTGYLNSETKKYTIKDINEFYIAVSSTPSRNGLVTYRTKKSSHLCSEKEQFRTKVQAFDSINI
jgi:hypothetical protein